MIIDIETVRSTVHDALLNAGVPQENASLQGAVLLDAQMRGVASHGLLRLPRVIERIRNHVCDPQTNGIHNWQSHQFLDVDGCQGLGPVVAMRALDVACDRATTSGVVAIGIRNNNHLGMLAWYADVVARKGFALVAMSTSEALVHPWGGREAMLGTNPIAIGVPAEPRPMVMDMATSLVSMGKIHDYANRGQSLEPGWAIDASGDPTTDAIAAKSGAITPFGGPKGYALGLAIEVLVTALTGSEIGRAVSGTLDVNKPCNKGDVFIVLKPHSTEALSARIRDYLQEVRECVPAKTDQPVSVPGDGSAARYEHARMNGIDVDSDLWQVIENFSCSHQT